MRVATYRNAFDRDPVVEDLSWPDLVSRLSTPRVSPRALCQKSPCDGRRRDGKPCDGKNGPAWSPVDIEGTRANDNVRAVTALVFDLDHLDPAGLGLAKLEASNLAFVIHSTHQHRDDHASLRLTLRPSRPLMPAEYPAIREAVVRELELPADPATKDLSRLYYLPNSVEGTEPLIYAREGESLDVEAFARLKPTSALRERVLLAEADPASPIEADPVNMNELAALIRGHASDENRKLVSGALRGESLGPQGKDANPYGGQDAALHALMSTAAFCAPDDTPWEAIEHLFAACFAATDWNEGTEHLTEVAREKFERARERKAKRDAKRKAETDSLWAAVGIARGFDDDLSPLDEGGTEDPDAWVAKLIKTREKEPKLAICEANVLRVLRHAPEWKDAIRFNQVSKKLELRNAPDGLQATEALDVTLSVWFSESAWGRLGLCPTPRMVSEALRAIPERMSFDPLLEYLDALKWDGVRRIDSFLERYFGANGDPPEYLKSISRRWLISLVARGLKPGTKVDTVLCLEGSQGLGKSTALRILADPWFCDTKIDIGNKDSWSLAGQFWILELAEAEGMTRAQAEALKAFFSRRDDTYRAPYGRTNATTPRRALFAVTTNAQRFLRWDPTGYRRFWPVTCGALDLAALRADRDQLLAEAVAAFKAGELWYFFPNTPEGQLAEAAARKREETVGEASQDMIADWLLAMPAEKRPKAVRVSELLTNPDVFGLMRSQVTRQREMELAEVLRAMGFEKFSASLGRAWKTPDAFLEAPQVKPIRGGSSSGGAMEKSA